MIAEINGYMPRRWFNSVLLLISLIKSSSWFLVGLISTAGSSNPVGRTNCSAIVEEIFFSYSEGVADTNIVFLLSSSKYSNFNWRLSYALGRLNL